MLDALKAADLILCEDTRVTAKLLIHFGIHTPTLAYHDHNAGRVMPRIMAKLLEGQRIVQVTDAGTPLVSDPGYSLVEAARANGVKVTTLPGASAVLAALAIAGLPTERFLFLGFLPPKSAARRRMLGGYAGVDATLVVFESPRRVSDCLTDMLAVFGDRQVAVCRELTKFYEEVTRGGLAELSQAYAAGDDPRGEVVIVVAPPVNRADDENTVARMLADALEDMSVREAADAVAVATGRPRREIYRMALDLAGKT